MHDDTEDQVVLESVYVEMDPVLEGFEGVLIELSRQDKSYILTETAAATGNLLLRFTSSRPESAYRLLQQHASLCIITEPS